MKQEIEKVNVELKEAEGNLKENALDVVLGGATGFYMVGDMLLAVYATMGTFASVILSFMGWSIVKDKSISETERRKYKKLAIVMTSVAAALGTTTVGLVVDAHFETRAGRIL